MSIMKDMQEQHRANIQKIAKKLTAKTCPHCLKEYTLGIDGVASGCDRCEGIVRLSNGMIDYDATYSETFIEEQS